MKILRSKNRFKIEDKKIKAKETMTIKEWLQKRIDSCIRVERELSDPLTKTAVQGVKKLIEVLDEGIRNGTIELKYPK